MIKAVIFDFDGLIIDTETAWFTAYREVLASVDVDLPLEVFAPFIGTHGFMFHEYLKEKAGAYMGLEEIQERAGKRHREIMAGLDARDGVREYLQEAKKLGLRIGLASSSDREWIERFLNRLNLIHYFEVMKTEDDVQRVKPDPELYLKTLAALKVSPEEALAFEDSANGAKAAKAAGLSCVIVPNPVTEGLTFERYEMRMKSMSELPLSEVIKQVTAKVHGV